MLKSYLFSSELETTAVEEDFTYASGVTKFSPIEDLDITQIPNLYALMYYTLYSLPPGAEVISIAGVTEYNDADNITDAIIGYAQGEGWVVVGDLDGVTVVFDVVFSYGNHDDITLEYSITFDTSALNE